MTLEDDEELFGLSFVDCIASSLGAVILLVLVLSALGQGRSELASLARVSIVLRYSDGNNDQPTKLKPFFVPPASSQRIPIEEALVHKKSEIAESSFYRSLQVFANREGEIIAWLTEPEKGVWGIEIRAESPPGTNPIVREASIDVGVGHQPLRNYDWVGANLSQGDRLTWQVRGEMQEPTQIIKVDVNGR